MRDAADYLNHIKALIVLDPVVRHWQTVREEIQGDAGLFRYRLILSDGSFLEAFEYFEVVAGNVDVTKYSFHWQDATGWLKKRWDNAPHYPRIATAPHHLHEGSETNVLPHEAMSLSAVLAEIAVEAEQEE